MSLSFRPANASRIHPSCWPAISWKSLRPLGVRRTRYARRSPSTSTRSTRPSATSWSVMPVTLPPVTIMRRDSSFIFRPSGLRSSCAIRSKRGKVVSNCSRSWVRTCFSTSCVQVSMRSQSRNASGCSLWPRASMSMVGLLVAWFALGLLLLLLFAGCLRRQLFLLGELAVHLVAPAQVGLGPLHVAALQLGRLVQGPGGVGQVRARNRAQVGAARRDDAVHVVHFRNRAHRDGLYAHLVADAIGKRRLVHAAVNRLGRA